MAPTQKPEEPIKHGAEGGTRTPTGVTPPPPQDGVSTNSTTSARTYDDNWCTNLSTEICLPLRAHNHFAAPTWSDVNTTINLRGSIAIALSEVPLPSY